LSATLWRKAVISKTAEYALRSMVCLAAKPSQPQSANVLADKTKVPRSYLNRVLQDLTAARLVRSRPGPGGGHELARGPDSISILDVVNAVAPIERIRRCPLGLASHTELCPLHRELDQAFAATEAAFSRVTLKNLVESTSRIVPLCELGQS
jgi:Rrf2 family transcriptional regulator, nitric oxide-sensitive transcriptional repressor